MTENDLREYLDQNKYKEPAERLIHRIFEAPPSRKTQGEFGNVRERFCSRSTRETRSVESGTESGYALLLEYDPSVLWYAAQPEGFSIAYENKDGKRVGGYIHPDFFVLKTETAGWVETKSRDELKDAHDDDDKDPAPFEKIDGAWRLPAAEEHAEQLGLFYEVVLDEDLNSTFISNLRYLDSY